MDCLICFKYIKKSCIGSCNHHFCYDCLIKWCTINNVCPKCKCDIREIRLDPEFDQLSFIILDSLRADSSLNSYLESYNIDSDIYSDIDNDIDNDIDIDIYNINDRNLSGTLLNSKIEVKEICIKFPVGSFAGISLENNRGPGVKITNLKDGGIMRKTGLKVSDVIIEINNVPCLNHKQAINIINHYMFSNMTLKCKYIETCLVYWNKFRS